MFHIFMCYLFSYSDFVIFRQYDPTQITMTTTIQLTVLDNLFFNVNCLIIYDFSVSYMLLNSNPFPVKSLEPSL